MRDKLHRSPLPTEVFGDEVPFLAGPENDEQLQLSATRAAITRAQRLELYDRYAAQSVTTKFRVLYTSEMELRGAVVGMYQEYQALVAKLQQVIGAQNETINALTETLAALEARVPKPQAEIQLNLELGNPEE